MQKGAGYWLWKPYFILHTLKNEILNDEVLFYSDSGVVFIDSFEDILNFFESSNLSQIIFETQQPEKIWTKRQLFIELGCDNEKYANSKQRIGGYSMWKKNEANIRFLEEWLTFAQNPDLITDSDNTIELPNYSGFKEHRHDQSILSLLSKIHDISAYRDPSQFGNKFKHLYPESNYEQFIFLQRQRNLNTLVFLKKKVKKFLVKHKLIH